MFKLPRRKYPHRTLSDRPRMKGIIQQYEEDGKIAIVYGGMDCDGCKWDGCVDIVPAQLVHVESWISHYYEWAEGYQWHDFAKPSQAKHLEESHRDLAMEAHEDGHPHVLYN
jgi:hypothetical protein